MAIKIVHGNLFDSMANYICHQVNCQGKMGSGVAKQIRARYPEAYFAYLDRCSDQSIKLNTSQLLGQAQFVKCSSGKTIVNMFAQNHYGYDGKRYTDYTALERCLDQIVITVPPKEIIAMPYKIGCGIGGGSWDVVSRLISEKLSDKYIIEFWRIDA